MEDVSAIIAKFFQWFITILLGIVAWFIKDKVSKVERKIDAHDILINDNENKIIKHGEEIGSLSREAQADRDYVRESLNRLEKAQEKILDKIEGLYKK